MHKLKAQRKRKVLLDILLIVLFNLLFWVFARNQDLLTWLQEYQLDKWIPLAFSLLLSLLYYALRRWRESVKLTFLAERRASKDALTQLYNRRALEPKLLSEWQRFIRYQESFCLIMLHIDDLKTINDSFGHQEGDRIIIEVAEKLLRDIRKTDFCSRWSGSEFLILCPVSELPPIVALAERLRADIYGLLTDGVELSVSIAVSQADKHKSVDELLQKAELQLTKAKQSGGNCVISTL